MIIETHTHRQEQNNAGVNDSCVCAGRSPWALRCRAETSTCTRACAATAFLWSPSAEDAWCARTACSCAPRAPGSSTHNALSPTSSTRRWCREKRCVHFDPSTSVFPFLTTKAELSALFYCKQVLAGNQGSCCAVLCQPTENLQQTHPSNSV